jgi:hypothetical protein
MHVFNNVYYEDDNIILSSMYQVPNVNSRRMFWIITNGKYRIINENVHKNIIASTRKKMGFFYLSNATIFVQGN